MQIFANIGSCPLYPSKAETRGIKHPGWTPFNVAKGLWMPQDKDIAKYKAGQPVEWEYWFYGDYPKAIGTTGENAPSH